MIANKGMTTPEPADPNKPRASAHHSGKLSLIRRIMGALAFLNSSSGSSISWSTFFSLSAASDLDPLASTCICWNKDRKNVPYQHSYNSMCIAHVGPFLNALLTNITKTRIFTSAELQELYIWGAKFILATLHPRLRVEQCYECYCIIMTGIKSYCIIMTGVTYPVCHFRSPSHDISVCVISLLLVCHFGYL